MSEDSGDFIPFVEVRFAGERFDMEYLPVDVAPTLQSYQNLIIEIARDIWREANPSRSRLPKNFENSFKLGIGSIKPTGSKTARLPRLREEDQPFLSEEFFSDVFLTAQERLSSVVNAANRTGEPRPVSEEVLKHLQTVRKHLGYNEILEITPTGEGKNKSSSFRISDKTVEVIKEISRFRKNAEVHGLGIVVGFDDALSSIKIVTPNGTFRFVVSWEKLRTFSNLGLGATVFFSVFAEVNKVEVIKSVIRYNNIELISDEPLAVRLKSRIDALVEDFDADTGDMKASSETVIRSKDLCAFLGRQYPKVAAFLTSEGGVQFEWKDQDVIINLAVVGQRLTLGASDLLSSKYNEASHLGVTSNLLSDLKNIRRFVDEGFE